MERKYRVKVNGKDCDIYEARVSAVPFHSGKEIERPIEHSEMSYFINITDDKPIDIEVETQNNFSEIVLRPLSKKIETETENKKINFSIKNYGQYVLEVDGEHNCLHIFYNKPDEFSEKEKPHIISAQVSMT